MKNTLELYLSETGILHFFEYLITPRTHRDTNLNPIRQ